MTIATGGRIRSARACGTREVPARASQHGSRQSPPGSSTTARAPHSAIRVDDREAADSSGVVAITSRLCRLSSTSRITAIQPQVARLRRDPSLEAPGRRASTRLGLDHALGRRRPVDAPASALREVTGIGTDDLGLPAQRSSGCRRRSRPAAARCRDASRDRRPDAGGSATAQLDGPRPSAMRARTSMIDVGRECSRSIRRHLRVRDAAPTIATCPKAEPAIDPA